jgi:hypothetical protein
MPRIDDLEDYDIKQAVKVLNRYAYRNSEKWYYDKENK